MKTSDKPKRMNVNVPASLHHQFKVAATLQGKDMTDVLLEFIQEYVRKNLPKELQRAVSKRG